VAVSPYLEDDTQAALGLALARAATQLRESGKAEIAALIDAEITTAKDSPLQRAYLAERGEDLMVTSSTNKALKTNAVAQPIDFEPQMASPN
jgi:stage V sporulation protein SpoVS